MSEHETGPEMLARLGIDGREWAREFHATAIRLGHPPMDEGWLIGWFCNAIMAGCDAPRADLLTAAEAERDAAIAREAALLAANEVNRVTLRNVNSKAFAAEAELAAALAHVERLKAALKPFADAANAHTTFSGGHFFSNAHLIAARAACADEAKP